MSIGSDRPRRTRVHYTTMELCLNRNAGPWGSVELIISSANAEDSQILMWPLGEHKQLTAGQIADLCCVVGERLSSTLYTRLKAQEEIPGLLGS